MQEVARFRDVSSLMLFSVQLKERAAADPAAEALSILWFFARFDVDVRLGRAALQYVRD